MLENKAVSVGDNLIELNADKLNAQIKLSKSKIQENNLLKFMIKIDY